MKKTFFSIFLVFLIKTTFSQCMGFMMTINGNNPLCHGFCDGSVTVMPFGGNGGEIFTITDTLGNQVNPGNGNVSNSLCEGWYFVTVIDNMGCTLEDSVYLEAPDEIDVALDISPLLCGGTETGFIEVDTVYNATGDYNQISYFWSPNPNGLNGIGEDSIGGLSAGDYSLTIIDENGCSNNWAIELNESAELVFTEFSFEPCEDGMGGLVYMSGAGGSPDYEYIWTNMSNGDSTFNTVWGGLSDACYEGTIIDANGCTIKDTACVSCLSIDEKNFDISIYPNPSIGIVRILSESIEIFDLKISDLTGKIAHSVTKFHSGNEIDLSYLGKGMYLISITNESQTGTYPLILE